MNILNHITMGYPMKNWKKGLKNIAEGLLGKNQMDIFS